MSPWLLATNSRSVDWRNPIHLETSIHLSKETFKIDTIAPKLGRNNRHNRLPLPCGNFANSEKYPKVLVLTCRRRSLDDSLRLSDRVDAFE